MASEMPWYAVKGITPEQAMEDYREAIKSGDHEASTEWWGRLPICPYGCGRTGTLLEVVMGPDSRAVGIFNDHPCDCIFTAEVALSEPPKVRKKKLVLGVDGEYHEEEE